MVKIYDKHDENDDTIATKSAKMKVKTGELQTVIKNVENGEISKKEGYEQLKSEIEDIKEIAENIYEGQSFFGFKLQQIIDNQKYDEDSLRNVTRILFEKVLGEVDGMKTIEEYNKEVDKKMKKLEEE